jgi:Spy/CpxP family protein refolding chaperone
MGSRMLAMLESDRVKAELNLTDQQVARLHQIALEGEKGSVKARAELQVRGLELRELLRADQPEREAVMKKVQEITELRGQMMRQHVESLLAAKTVLTPEQQQKFRSLRAGRAGRMGRRGPGFGSGSRPSQPAEPPQPPSQ